MYYAFFFFHYLFIEIKHQKDRPHVISVTTSDIVITDDACFIIFGDMKE